MSHQPNWLSVKQSCRLSVQITGREKQKNHNLKKNRLNRKQYPSGDSLTSRILTMSKQRGLIEPVLILDIILQDLLMGHVDFSF